MNAFLDFDIAAAFDTFITDARQRQSCKWFYEQKNRVLFSHHLYRMLNRTIFASNSINGATISRTMFLCVFVVVMIIIIVVVVVVVVVYYSLSIFSFIVHKLFVAIVYSNVIIYIQQKKLLFILFARDIALEEKKHAQMNDTHSSDG